MRSRNHDKMARTKSTTITEASRIIRDKELGRTEKRDDVQMVSWQYLTSNMKRYLRLHLWAGGIQGAATYMFAEENQGESWETTAAMKALQQYTKKLIVTVNKWRLNRCFSELYDNAWEMKHQILQASYDDQAFIALEKSTEILVMPIPKDDNIKYELVKLRARMNENHMKRHSPGMEGGGTTQVNIIIKDREYQELPEDRDGSIKKVIEATVV